MAQMAVQFHPVSYVPSLLRMTRALWPDFYTKIGQILINWKKSKKNLPNQAGESETTSPNKVWGCPAYLPSSHLPHRRLSSGLAIGTPGVACHCMTAVRKTFTKPRGFTSKYGALLQIFPAILGNGMMLSTLRVIFSWLGKNLLSMSKDPKLEVPTIYKAYFSGLNFRGYPQKIWPKIWQSTSILGSWNSHWSRILHFGRHAISMSLLDLKAADCDHCDLRRLGECGSKKTWQQHPTKPCRQ